MYKLFILAGVLVFAADADAAAQPIRFKGSVIANNRYDSPRTQAGEITFEGEYAADLALPLNELLWEFDISTDGQSVTIHDMTATFAGTIQINPLVSIDLNLKASITEKTVDINPTTTTVWRVQHHEFTSMSVSGLYKGLGLTKSFSGSLADSSSSTFELGLLDFAKWPSELSWNAQAVSSSGSSYSNEWRVFSASSQNGWIGVEPYLHIRQVQIWEPVSAVLAAIPSAADTADFNHDGMVDGADFLKWQRDDRSALTLDKWKQQFGTTAAVTAVPEPSSVVLTILALFALRRRAN